MNMMSSKVFSSTIILTGMFSLSSATLFNLSAISSNSTSVMDQQVSESQHIPSIKSNSDYNFDIFNQAAVDMGKLSPDVQIYEVLQPPADMHSQLYGQYLNPLSSISESESGLPHYEHDIDAHNLYDESDFESDLQWNKPKFGHWKGGGHHKGALKNHLSKHKLKKLLRHHRGHHRKHKNHGHYFSDLGSYVDDISHHLTSSSADIPQIPKFIPFPISFPSFGVGGGIGGIETDLFKAMLIPLAGVALLGAAATTMFIANPFVWSLPFSLLIGHTGLGHLGLLRRRRDVTEGNETLVNEVIKTKLEEMRVLDDFLQQTSKAEVIIQEKKILATYLMTQAVCLERLVCSLHQHRLPDNLRREGIVMSIVTKEILANEYVPPIIRDNILRARQVGWSAGNCLTFPCQPYHPFAYKR